MGLRIQTNVASLGAQRNLFTSTGRLNQHMEKLSSGYRINKAADDAAGLAISEKLNAQVRGLAQSTRNASDGISLVQTAEGGLNEITNVLSRLRELGVQAASDTVGDIERGFLQKEYSALQNEIERIAMSTEFNGTNLLTGGTDLPESLTKNNNKPPLEIQVGANYHADVDSLDAENPVDIIRIDLRKLNALPIGDEALGIGNGIGDDSARVDSKKDAQLSLGRIDTALDKVNSYRAELGSIQNRLGSSVSNLRNQIENLTAAKSRIKDAAFAEESAGLAQQNILQQSGVSVLSQANQIPQQALKLLQ